MVIYPIPNISTLHGNKARKRVKGAIMGSSSAQRTPVTRLEPPSNIGLYIYLRYARHISGEMGVKYFVLHDAYHHRACKKRNSPYMYRDEN